MLLHRGHEALQNSELEGSPLPQTGMKRAQQLYRYALMIRLGGLLRGGIADVFLLKVTSYPLVLLLIVRRAPMAVLVKVSPDCAESARVTQYLRSALSNSSGAAPASYWAHTRLRCFGLRRNPLANRLGVVLAQAIQDQEYFPLLAGSQPTEKANQDLGVRRAGRHLPTDRAPISHRRDRVQALCTRR